MTAESIRHRLSMAVFYEADRLWSTIVELMVSGVGIDQQGCAGRHEVLTSISPPQHLSWDLSARLLVLVRCVEPYDAAPALEAIYATSGGVLHSLPYICPTRGGPDQAISVWSDGSGARNGACRSLRRHLDAGAILLFVAAVTPAQQAASSQTLLRNSRHGVQTFEFTCAEDE
jgi:hypothetical protein